jgi:hypothetical protein
MAAPSLALVPPRVTLREYIAEVDALIDLVEQLDATDELTPGVVEQLQHDLCSAVAGTRSKVDNTAKVIAAYEAASAACVIEEKRLKARREFLDRQAARLEDYVLATLAASGLKKIEGNTVTLSSRDNPARVVVDVDVEELPFDYIRTPPIPADEPDKKKIAEALKRGEEVNGCRLVVTSRLVRK